MPDFDSGPPPLSGGELVAQSPASESTPAAAQPAVSGASNTPQSDPTLQPRQPSAERALAGTEDTAEVPKIDPTLQPKDRFNKAFDKAKGGNEAGSESNLEASNPLEAEQPNPADDEAATGEDELEDLDKIKETANAKGTPRWARKTITKLATELETVRAEAANVLKFGGKEGLEQLHGLALTASNPNKFDDFAKFVEQTPHYNQFKNKVFWEYADHEPTLDRLLQDKLGSLMPGVELKWADALEIVKGIAEGEYPDLDELRERRTLRMSDDDRKKYDAEQERITRLERDNADLKRGQAEHKAAETKQAIDADWKTYETSQLQSIKPHAQKLGMLIGEKDPPGIQTLKAQHIKNVLKELDAELKADEDYNALWKMNANRMTNTLAYGILKAQVVSKAEALFRRIAKANQPFLVGALKTHNEPEARAVAQTPKLPTGAPGSIVTPTAQDRSAYVDPDARKAKFTQMVENGSAAANRGARV